MCLPETFKIGTKDESGTQVEVNRIQCFACTMCGLVSGFLIGIVTEYYTSNEYSPV